MRQILLYDRLMPFYGIFIRICHRLGFYLPLVWLTNYFIQGTPKNGRKIRILALGGERFRGDLEVLKDSGKFEVFSLPYGWENRLLYCFFRIHPSFEAVYHPNEAEQKQHACLNGFMQKFLPLFYQKSGIDIVINAAAHYQNDYLWGSNSSKVGVPFVIFHRECFHTTKERRDFWIDRWKPATGKYIFDFCVFHNEIIRKNYADSGVFPLEKTASCGAMRMDNFVRKYYKKPVVFPKKKQIVFFSFNHCVGLGGSLPLWSSYDNPQGFAKMFEESHVAFIEFAKDNPDVNCVLKPKWGGVWVEEFYKVSKRHNINVDKIPNLKIIEKADVHKLIEDTTVVCSYGSTTILEAGLMGRPVVITLMAEGLRDDYQDQIQLKSDFGFYDIARNKEELHSYLSKYLENPVVEGDIQRGREALFGKWISPLSANAADQYIAVLEHQYKQKQQRTL